VLSRKVGESLIIGDSIVITVEKVTPTTVKISIKAPEEIAIYREEILSHE